MDDNDRWWRGVAGFDALDTRMVVVDVWRCMKCGRFEKGYFYCNCDKSSTDADTMLAVKGKAVFEVEAQDDRMEK